MADMTDNPDFVVSLRRFGKRQLTGPDLCQIRTALLGISQEKLAASWGISRNEISRIEKLEQPELKTCDAYRGLLLLYFVER